MEFSFEDPSQSPSSLGSDRLQKAIERNRAKQAKRARKSRATVVSAPPRRPSSGVQAQSASATERRTTSQMRRSVARPENVEFSSDFRKTKEAPAPVSYTRATPTRRKKVATRKRAKASTRRKNSKLQQLLIKFGWLFCGFLVLRLIFAGGGIIEFYQKTSLVERKDYELKMLEKENQVLKNELVKIKESANYQKKVVRDNLGFIAPNEYLILFPKEKNQKSI